MRELTHARNRKGRGAGTGCGVPFGIFLAFVQQYQGLERSGAFVNLTARRFRRRSFRIRNADERVRDWLTDRCRYLPDAYNTKAGVFKKLLTYLLTAILRNKPNLVNLIGTIKFSDCTRRSPDRWRDGRQAPRRWRACSPPRRGFPPPRPAPACWTRRAPGPRFRPPA